MIYILLILFIWLLKTLIFALPLGFPKFKLRPSCCSIFYGGPGSGKTTLACYFARRAIKSGIPVYSNVPITGAYILKKSDLGTYAIHDALVIIDEVGIEYNNRDFRNNFTGGREMGRNNPPPAGAAGSQKNDPNKSKKVDQNKALEWWKKHRHEGCEVMVFSQGFDDMDKKIQTLGSHYYIVRQSLLGNFIVTKRIRKSPQIDKMTHQPIDEYSYMLFSTKRVFKRPLWKYFDSFDRMDLPEKEFAIYGQIREERSSGSDSGVDNLEYPVYTCP